MFFRPIKILWIFLLIFPPYLTYPVAGPLIDEKLGSPSNPYPVPRRNTILKINGSLDEDAWKEARVIELNYEVSPRDNVKPVVKTEILLTYSKSCFYIGFRNSAILKIEQH